MTAQTLLPARRGLGSGHQDPLIFRRRGCGGAALSKCHPLRRNHCHCSCLPRTRRVSTALSVHLAIPTATTAMHITTIAKKTPVCFPPPCHLRQRDNWHAIRGGIVVSNHPPKSAARFHPFVYTQITGNCPCYANQLMMQHDIWLGLPDCAIWLGVVFSVNSACCGQHMQYAISLCLSGRPPELSC